LLTLSFAVVDGAAFRATIKTLSAIAIATAVLYLISVLLNIPQLYGEGHPDEYHGLLASHTGAGTFFGCIAVFIILFVAEKRSRVLLLLSFLLLAPLIASASREALTGVLAAFAWYWGWKRKHPKVVPTVMVVLAVSLLTLMLAADSMSSKTYNRTIGLLSLDMVESIADQTEIGIRSDWAPGSGVEDLASGDVTSLSRIMMWVYATKRFLSSPIFGMGWGRFNDRELIMLDVSPILSVASGGEKIFSAGSAHNSYFHLLAESGLIGILLYLPMWLMLYLRCVRAESVFYPFQSMRSYYVACQGLIIYIVFCAFTGHALASPSVMIPVVTIVGVGIAHYRTILKVAH
jgi:O-antigen ligase